MQEFLALRDLTVGHPTRRSSSSGGPARQVKPSFRAKGLNERKGEESHPDEML